MEQHFCSNRILWPKNKTQNNSLVNEILVYSAKKKVHHFANLWTLTPRLKV
jgi:hypothetical protein